MLTFRSNSMRELRFASRMAFTLLELVVGLEVCVGASTLTLLPCCGY
jgi:hypothetical protein